MYKLTCCVALAVAGLGGQAVAGIINVPSDQPTIQAGIDAAVNGDEVVVAPGTYNETVTFLGKAITLRSSGGPVVTTIDAQGSGSVVTCDSGEGPNTVIEGFTITGGGSLSINGGGMLNSASSPTVMNCNFSGNTAANGGGMYNSEGSPTVTNCTFSGNSAVSVFFFGFGGGMYNVDSSPTVTNCTFTGNSVGCCNGSGGGMYNSASSPTVINCTFSGNSANNFGGAMLNHNSSPMVINCTFSENTVTGRGGGMYNSEGSPTVINCTFSGNGAKRGGGIANEFGGNPTVINCTFSDNSTTFGGGGGMFNNSSNPTVINCTFSGNSANTTGGAMLNDNSSPTVTNGILWGNSPNEIADAEPAAMVRYSDVQGGWPGIGNIDADPLFVDPLNGDFRLSPSSPSIDAADNTAVPFNVTTDLDGNPRFVDDPGTPDTGNPDGVNPIVDMGAYEFQPPCPWDCQAAPQSGAVDVPDLLALLGAWGGPQTPGTTCDLDGSGVIAVPDLLKLLGNWGPCP